MPQTKDFGPFYWHTLAVPSGGKRFDRAWSVEIEPPFRRGTAYAFRIRGRAFIIGHWSPSGDVGDVGDVEDAALRAAVGGHTLEHTPIEIRTWRRPERVPK